MTERNPVSSEALVDGAPATQWSKARDRIANPQKSNPFWLATVHEDGRPHLMPLIGLWMDDAFYFLSGEGTQKGRNLIADPHCVISTSSTTVPSVDLIIEAKARKIEDDAELRKMVEAYGSKLEWPLEVRDGGVFGPNAPTAGPPPYALFEAKPTTVFALPGMAGMEETDPDDRFTPTRWQF